MKMIKTLAAVTAAALMSVSAFAASDELNNATANAVDNDSTYLLNLIDWNKLSFEKGYGLVSLSSENTGNLGGALKLKNGNTLHGYWYGNLWEEDATNVFQALYGFNNMAVSAGFTKLSGGTKAFSAGFGDNLDSKKAFDIKGAYEWNDSLTDYIFEGEFVYTFAGDNKADGNLKRVGVNASLEHTANSDTDFSTSVITLNPFYNLQLNAGKGLKFGSKGTMPLTVYTGDSKDYLDNSIGFELRNGFTAQIKPTVAFAAGLATTLPTYYFGDTENGEFKNSFWLGCGIDVTPAVKLDVSANIKPTEDDDSGSDGESLDEIWKQSFAISFSIKF